MFTRFTSVLCYWYEQGDPVCQIICRRTTFVAAIPTCFQQSKRCSSLSEDVSRLLSQFTLLWVSCFGFFTAVYCFTKYVNVADGILGLYPIGVAKTMQYEWSNIFWFIKTKLVIGLCLYYGQQKTEIL